MSGGGPRGLIVPPAMEALGGPLRPDWHGARDQVRFARERLADAAASLEATLPRQCHGSVRNTSGRLCNGLRHSLRVEPHRTISGMQDDKRVARLRVDSDELLRSLDEMKQLEEQKRGEIVSTDEFHRLADDIERQARHVHELAVGEAVLDDEIPSTETTIEDTPPDEESGPSGGVR